LGRGLPFDPDFRRHFPVDSHRGAILWKGMNKRTPSIRNAQAAVGHWWWCAPRGAALDP
jgi:hypothetical protein